MPPVASLSPLAHLSTLLSQAAGGELAAAQIVPAVLEPLASVEASGVLHPTDMPEQEAIAKNLAEAYVVKAHQEEAAGNADLASDWIARARELNPQVTEDQPPPP